MSNKTQLQTNNTNLDALISRVNAAKNVAASLPEAGGSGGSLETVTVTFEEFPDPGSVVYYVDGSQTLQTTDIQQGLSITAQKNTILVTTDYWGEATACSYITGGMMRIFFVTG